jgi:hypothetical protein
MASSCRLASDIERTDMTGTPKMDGDKDTQGSSEQASPRAPTKRRLPTDDELRALGFKVLPPSGKGYSVPMGRRPAKKTEA